MGVGSWESGVGISNSPSSIIDGQPVASAQLPTPNSQLLIIGYGNPYRRDDGVAWHVINALRARLGRPPLPLDETGEDDLGHAIDTVMAHQLVPELALLLPPYSRVIFVDAHIGEIRVPLRVIEVEPGGEFQATTHHFGPGMLLALAQTQSGATPRGWLVSIRGDDFNYGETLTETCASQVNRAVEEILGLASTS